MLKTHKGYLAGTATREQLDEDFDDVERFWDQLSIGQKTILHKLRLAICETLDEAKAQLRHGMTHDLPWTNDLQKQIVPLLFNGLRVRQFLPDGGGTGPRAAAEMGN